MTWIDKEFLGHEDHVCYTPPVTHEDVGREWRCTRCDSRMILVEAGSGLGLWKHILDCTEDQFYAKLVNEAIDRAVGEENAMGT